jgi:hypothetical protein
MLTIRATFNIFGYQTREVDLTPALGVSLIALIILLVGKTTMGV